MFGGGGGVFDSSFRAYPVSFIDKVRTPRAAAVAPNGADAPCRATLDSLIWRTATKARTHGGCFTLRNPDASPRRHTPQLCCRLLLWTG